MNDDVIDELTDEDIKILTTKVFQPKIKKNGKGKLIIIGTKKGDLEDE